ncbi:MAG: beta-ketoacyl-ACP synthase II [Candidatus Hydrogenedentes bacterium]|nr:beta-ketoacyl-ACP synthase II [Candidatus Hydrogenedentota bacterium]
MRNKVVITGMGVVSPVGNDIKTFWNSLCEGRCGIHAIRHFDASELPTRIAAEAEDVVPRGVSAKDLRRKDRYTIFALEAADQAWEQAGIDMARETPGRCGVIVGSGIGGLATLDEQVKVFASDGARRVSPLMIPKVIANMASGEIAIRYGLQGPNRAIVTACATSTQCIGDSANMIRYGKADVMLTGGAESSIIPFGIAGFGAMKALSCRNDEPERASRPFDLDRDGFVMGEGAGILVLESEQHAKARGAVILGEVLGMGESCDAYHIVAPNPDGVGAKTAMEAALDDSGVNAADVGYYNAHGTSTKYNDAAESLALHMVFGETTPPVSSTKSMTGHLLGAAGAIEAIACVLALRDGILPPNINYDKPDPECDVDIIANSAREAKIDVAMSTSLGFGGHNASILMKRA